MSPLETPIKEVTSLEVAQKTFALIDFIRNQLGGDERADSVVENLLKVATALQEQNIAQAAFSVSAVSQGLQELAEQTEELEQFLFDTFGEEPFAKPVEEDPPIELAEDEEDADVNTN